MAQRNEVMDRVEKFPPMESQAIPSEWGDQAQLTSDGAMDAAEESDLMIRDPLAYEDAVIRRDIERNRNING